VVVESDESAGDFSELVVVGESGVAVTGLEVDETNGGAFSTYSPFS
jgi:hypothetical protein